MRKAVLLSVLAAGLMFSITPGEAANPTTGSSGSGIGLKIRDGARAVGRGIMWGPKKIGEGFKAMGDRIKGSGKKSSK